MKIESILNGSISIVLIPETDLEKAMLKQFSKQTIELIEFSKQTAILNKQFTEGLIIQQKTREEVKIGVIEE